MTLWVEVQKEGVLPPAITQRGTKKLELMLTAAAHTAEYLANFGLDVTVTDSALQEAAKNAYEFAKDPMTTSKKLSGASSIAKMTPVNLLATKKVLQEYGHSVVDDAIQLRHMVTNKLVQETENPDPRIRLKALELLGKHCDVGLFSEKSEVTITHQTADDLRDKLRSKLSNLIDVTPTEVEEAQSVDVQQDDTPVEPAEEEGGAPEAAGAPDEVSKDLLRRAQRAVDEEAEPDPADDIDFDSLNADDLDWDDEERD